MTDPDRVRVLCLVPYCRHSRRLGPAETVACAHAWICGDHWKLVPVRLKRRRQRILRIWRKASRKNLGRAEYRARILYWRQWDQIRVAAIEIAVGITAARKPLSNRPRKAKPERTSSRRRRPAE